MKDAACFRCKYWSQSSDAGRPVPQGECRRRAPQSAGNIVVPVNMPQNVLAPPGGPQQMRPLLLFGFPTTGQDAWCGEYEIEPSVLS